MIVLGPNPVRRQRAIACLSVSIASLLCASGAVLTERVGGRGLSEMLADALRPDRQAPVVSGQTEDAAPGSGDAALAAGAPSGAASTHGAGTAGPQGSSAAATGADHAGSRPGDLASGDGPARAGTNPTSKAAPRALPVAGPQGGSAPVPGATPAGSGDTAGGGAGSPLPGDGSQGGSTPAPDGRHPLEQEVDALKPFVEREAGHTFKGPVAVRVVSDSDFSSRLAELNWLPRGEAAEQLEGVYRALGLIGPSVDLPAELAKFTRSEVVTLYDAVAGELLIRDRAADPYLRTMLVRELTRALDDQYFDIYRPGLDGVNQEARDGLKALVEGDAARVQDRYTAGLSALDRTRYESERQRVAAQTPTDINRAVLTRFTYAVTQGLKLVEALLSAGGRARLDGAFAAPPVSSEQVLAPDRFLAGDGPKSVPEPAADGPIVSRGVLGQVGLFSMLRETTDEDTATRGAQGWGADRFVSWRDGSRTCVRQTIVSDSAGDASELASALQKWSQSQAGAEVVGQGPFTIKRCA